MSLGRIRPLALFALVMGWSLAGQCPAQTSASEHDAAGRVYVDNGDFEKGRDNWEGKGVIVTEVKHGGDHSLLLERAYVYQPPRNQRLIWIKPGHDYRVSLWVKCDGCEEQGVSVTAACLGGAGEHDRKWISRLQGANPQYIHDNGASAALVATGGTHDWKKLEAHIPADQLSKQTRALFIYLRHDAQKEPRGKAYFDDLTVERLPRDTVKTAVNGKLVKNGSFEEGNRGWGGPGMRKPDAIVQTDPSEGKFSLKLADGYVFQERVPVEGPKRYRVSMKIRCERTTEGSVFVQLSYRGSRIKPEWRGPVQVAYNNRNEPAVFVTGGTHGSKDFTAVVAAPNQANQLLIYLRKHNGSEGVAYYDDVKVEQTEDPKTTPQDLRRAGMAPSVPTVDDTDFARAQLDNTGFEQGDRAWVRKGATEIVSISASAGTASLKMIGGSALQGLKVQEKKSYKINIKIKTVAMAEGTASVQLQFRGPTTLPRRLQRSKPIATGGTTDGWQDLSSIVKVPPKATDMLIYLTKGTDDGIAWFDDLEVMPADERAPTAGDRKNADLARLLPPSPSGQDANSAIETAIKLGNQASPERLTLGKDGTASYKIYVGSRQDAIELYAAEELAEYLGKISGASFEPFAHDAHPAAGPLLVVGRRNALTDKLCPDIPYDRLGDDGFVVRTVGPHVVIAGNTSRGTLYGVYWLLDRKLGVRWFSPAYTFVPRTPRLTLGKLTEMQVPRFEYREIFARDGDNEAYRAHNLLNGKSHHRKTTHSAPGLNSWSGFWPDEGHNFHRVVSHMKYSKSHPEYFAGGQLAMMNEDVRRIAAEYFVNKIAKLKGAAIPWLGFSQADRGWAPDPASLAFAKKHGGHLSAPNADMVLDVAQRVRQKYPGAKFGAMAYQWTFSPPTGMTLPDHVLMVAAPNHADFSQPYNGSKNKSFAEDIQNWTNISSNVHIWDYITNFSGYMLPYPNFDSMFESIQWLAGMPSIRGYFAQGSMSSIGAEFAHLRQWVGARLLWDPEQDHQALVDEFMEGHYGDAAPYIAEYIRLLHESKKKTGAKMALRTPVTSPYLSFEAMRRADELFAKAEEAVAREPGFERRVATARIGVDAVILFRRGDYASEAKKAGSSWDPDTQRRLQRVTDNVRSAGVTAYGEGMTDVKSYLKTMALERTVTPPLDIVRGLSDTDWMEFNDLDLRIAIGGVTITPDPLASDGGAITMKGNSPHWGIQMKLDALPSEGQWKLFASVRVDPGSGSEAATALTFGVHPGHRRTIKVSEVADGQYHTFELPGTYFNDAGTALWFAPPNSDAIKAMYVDRVVAIRADASASISSDVLNPRALRIWH